MRCHIVQTLLIIVITISRTDNASGDVRYVEARDDPVNFVYNGKNKLCIFCHEGEARRIFYAWHSASLNISNFDDSFKLYQGPNATSIMEKYETDYRSWIPFYWLLFGSSGKSRIHLETFSHSCVGIVSHKDYSVNLLFKLEPLYLLLSVAAIMLFLNAHKCSRQLSFYYGCGISSFMLASILLLILLINRFFPLRRGLYGMLILGGSMTLAFLQLIYQQFEVVFVQYKTWLIAYLCTSGFLGFCVVHWFGPPVNKPRTVQLVQWTLQLISVAVLLMVVQISEVAWITICGLVLSQIWRRIIPFALFRAVQFHVWYRFFPPRRRYLTQEEYDSMAQETTREALEDLRSFCQSPNCSAWKVVNRLKCPKRFASFVESGEHLEDNEVTDWDSVASHSLSMPTGDMIETDDETSSDESVEFNITSTPNR